MADPRQTPAPAYTGITPAGATYDAYTPHTAAAAAAAGTLAISLHPEPKHRFWCAVWVGPDGTHESPVCGGRTRDDAVAALFGEGDDTFA